MKVFSDLNIALVNSLPLLQLFNKKNFQVNGNRENEMVMVDRKLTLKSGKPRTRGLKNTKVKIKKIDLQ